MPNGEFAVNWDGKHERCYQLEVDYAKHAIFFNKDNHVRHVDDWSTFSVSAIAHKEASDIGCDGGEPSKIEEVKKA